MNKQAKIIIGVLTTIIVILLVIIFILLNKDNNKSDTPKIDNKEVKQAVGIYHNSNWNKHDVTLQLNDDMTCKYPNSSDICKWTISDNEITITLSNYNIKYDNENKDLYIMYGTKEKCEEDLNKNKEKYNLINPRCEKVERGTHKATLISSGVLLHDHVFNRVN